MSKKIEPSLESITVRGKYEIRETDFNIVIKKVSEALRPLYWIEYERVGESVKLVYTKKLAEVRDWWKQIEKLRTGLPLFLFITTIEHYNK